MRLKSKRIQAIIVFIIAALIVLSGTYAWYSFTQRRVNVFELTTKPGVNLHDDFEGGTDKDVYVENSGDIGLYVRVRLTEYMETVNRGSLLAGHSRGIAEGESETDIARMQWSPHSGINHAESCTIRDTDSINSTWNQSDNFHNYYVWTMGGQKYYKPAILQHPDTALSDDPEVCVDTEIYTGTEENVKQTLTAFVITMEQWMNGGYIKPDGEAMLPKESGEFWVVDTDGWCYWAQMLNPDEATGLLIDKVERTSKQFDSDVEYCINVWLQAIDLSEIERLPYAENGGITSNAELLLHVLADGAMIASDGSIYEDNNDGTFVTTVDKGGNTIEEPKAFVPLGDFAAASTGVKAGVSEEQRLYIGDKVNITDLIWDGEAYTNYGDWTVDDAPFYNITTDESGQYTVMGTEIGADENVYLRLEDGNGQSLYLASVLAVSAFAPESPANYVQGYPGTGPFGFIWPGSEGIGSENDERRDPDKPIEKRYFHHIGNGVYIEIADKDSAEAIDAPNTTYYFSSQIFGDNPYEINNIDGHPVGAKMDAIFSFTLQIGEKFGILDDKDTGYSVILKGAEMDAALESDEIETEFIMKALYKHEKDGKLYIDLTEFYANLYLAGMGENGEFGGLYSGETASVNESGEMKPSVVANRAPGFGTPEEPFEIDSRDDMNWLTREAMNGNMFGNQYLVVTDNFSMGDKDFLPIGSATKPFKGTFDGGGYTISDLRIAGSAGTVGLFGCIGEGGTLENLTLTNVSVNITGASVGGLAGRNEGTLENCHIVSGSIIAAGNNVGSITGYNTGTVESCSNAANVKGNQNTGGVIGYNIGTVADCDNSGHVENNSNSNTGGIVGHNGNATALTATVMNSKNTGNIAGANYTGGIVGTTYGDVTGCENSGKVSGGQNVGGVAGLANADVKVENCKNLSGGTVTGTANSSSAGGVVGYNYGAVSYCENGGAINGVGYVGGVVGNNLSGAKIANCKNLSGSTVTGTGSHVGGVTGANNGEVTKCENNAAINGVSNVGGVVGLNNSGSTVQTSFSTGASTGTSSIIGGVVGQNIGAVQQCYATGRVQGRDYTAGIVGLNTGNITNSYSWSEVYSLQSVVGGIAGHSQGGSITYSYHAKGSITAQGCIGGLVGKMTGGTLTRCAAFGTGIISGNGVDINKVTGQHNSAPTVSYCFASSAFSMNKAANGNGSAGSTMVSSSANWASGTYTAFNLTTVWRWDGTNNLPVLRDVTP